MFMPNDVYSLESRRIRVLWSNRQAIFWIDIDDEKALPKLSPRNEFEHLMASGELTAIADPYLDLSMNSPKPGSRAEQVQKRAWEAIKDIVTKEPEIYQRATRGPTPFNGSGKNRFNQTNSLSMVSPLLAVWQVQKRSQWAI